MSNNNKIVGIIDYGMGNVNSIKKSLKKLNVESIITNNEKELLASSHLILPGVGHFKKGMQQLKSLGLVEVLNEAVCKNNVPILGICLGMQLFTEHSEEGSEKGLEWINAKTKKFCFSEENFRVPHIGWNIIKKKNDLFVEKMEDEDQFYFVHSYYVDSSSPTTIATTEYGHEFASIVREKNIIGAQFHPEKSFSAGLKVFNSFLNL